MRIDGSIPNFSPDRGPRSGTALTPYREAQREVETRREQPAAVGASQGLEQTAQIRRVQTPNDTAQSRSLQTPYQDYQPAMSNRAAQAIASYSSTAEFITESDAQQVLGLDLYA